MHADRLEWKKQDSLTGILKKNSYLGKWDILGPKIADPHNSGSAWRIFFNFAQRKGIIDTSELNWKIFLGANGQFGTQKWCIVITLDPLSGLFKILHNKKDQ